MSKLSNKKTFYAKAFEEPIRQFFNCPSKTTSKKPFPYFFILNRDNPTHIYRTKDNGMADIYTKEHIEGDLLEERFLTFFPYQNHATGGFSIGTKQWECFLNAVNKSNETNHWGVFCISATEFILANNANCFISHDTVVTVNSYSFSAVEVYPQNAMYFELSNGQWRMVHNGQIELFEPDYQYRGILPSDSFCPDRPRIGKEHLFCIKTDNTYEIVSRTFAEITNSYHGSLDPKVFNTKLRRNYTSNEKRVSIGLRMSAVDNLIISIPDDFDENYFIEWQKEHPKNKTENKNYRRNKMRELRQSRKSSLSGNTGKL